MEIESIHKYIALNKLANGTVEVMFSGQPCLTVQMSPFNEQWSWKINPVFAKLVYGANVMEDIPHCADGSKSSEESIAGGLVKLHELGAFNTEVDFPEDTYAATLNAVMEDIKTYSLTHTKSIMEAHVMSVKIMKEKLTEDRENRSEFSANMSLGKIGSLKSPVSTTGKKFYLKDSFGKKVSTAHDSESDAMKTFRSLPSTRGIKIMREELSGDVDITLTLVESKETDYDSWRENCKSAHPTKKLFFKSYLDDGQSTVSAEEKNVDKSHGVWDHTTNTGRVFKVNENVTESKHEEKVEQKEILQALKKDKKFVAKYGQGVDAMSNMTEIE